MKTTGMPCGFFVEKVLTLTLEIQIDFPQVNNEELPVFDIKLKDLLDLISYITEILPSLKQNFVIKNGMFYKVAI